MDRMKTCKRCQESKPEEEFSRARAQCKECRRELARQWWHRTKDQRLVYEKKRYERDREQRNELSRANYRKQMQENPEAWREKNLKAVKKYKVLNPEVQLRTDLRNRNGLSLEEYKAMVQAQNGQCAICGRVPEDHRLAVDHDHETGKIRELLCRSCNVGIGNLKDDPALLSLAAAYLIKHSATKADEETA